MTYFTFSGVIYQGEDGPMKKVFVAAVGLAPEGQSGFVLLKEEGGKTVLPIGSGSFEAKAISQGLRGTQSPRPTPYDMMKSVLNGLEAKIVRIVVNNFAEDTFFAQITLRTDGTDYEVDSRPSDAIALALRTEAPIYVVEDVLKSAGLTLPEQGESEDMGEFLQRALRSSSGDDSEAEGGEEPQGELERLKADLQHLVDQEEYEQAAELRDKIRILEGQEDGGE